MKENTLKYSGGMRRLFMLGGAILFASAMASSARADIKYTQETRMNEEQNAAPTSVTTRMVSPDAERTDIKSNYGKTQFNQSTIVLCKDRQEYQVDDGLKIYTVKSLDDKTKPGGQKPEKGSDKEREQKDGKIVATYTVKYLGEEMVANFKTRHYMITTDMQMTGCIGDGRIESKVEVWVSDIQDASACAPKYDASSAYAAMAQGDCKMTFEQKGDAEAYAKVYTGIVLRQKMYMGDKVLMTTEVTSLSQAKLDNTPFAIPAGYKQVTAEEFQTQQSAAMMQAMMTGQMPIGE